MKDGLQPWCKECNKAYNKQWRADNSDYYKQYRAEHKEDRTEYSKQYYADNPEYFKQYYTEHKEEKAEYSKQYYTKRYATLEGYAYAIRYRNLQADREQGRCGKDEDILPPQSFYIEKFSEGIDYYDGKQYHWSELGFDRIDDSKPHTVDNIVLATTFHNKDKWYKRMSVEEYKAYIQKQNEELELVL